MEGILVSNTIRHALLQTHNIYTKTLDGVSLPYSLSTDIKQYTAGKPTTGRGKPFNDLNNLSQNTTLYFSKYFTYISISVYSFEIVL